MQRSKIQKAHRNVCLFVVVVFVFFFFFFYGVLILIQIEKPLANTLPNRNKPRKQRNHNLIKSDPGAEPHCPLGGAVALAKKKKSPPAYILILIGPPNDVHLPPLPFLFNT